MTKKSSNPKTEVIFEIFKKRNANLCATLDMKISNTGESADATVNNERKKDVSHRN